MIERIKDIDLDSVIKLVKCDDVRPHLQIEKDTPRKGVETFLFNLNNVVFVSKAGNAVNGLIVGMLKQGKRKHTVELIIAVAKEYWGKGVALELLKSLEQHCKKNGIIKLDLSTYSSNRRALNFYLKT